MKKLCKLFTLLLAVTVLCFTATACGSGAEPKPTTTPSVSAAPSVSATPSVSTMPSVSTVPSTMPTAIPTVQPTVPTVTPTVTPSVVPSVAPSVKPSVVPSILPSVTPTVTPTVVPSASIAPQLLQMNRYGVLVSMDEQEIFSEMTKGEIAGDVVCSEIGWVIYAENKDIFMAPGTGGDVLFSEGLTISGIAEVNLCLAVTVEITDNLIVTNDQLALVPIDQPYRPIQWYDGDSFVTINNVTNSVSITKETLINVLEPMPVEIALPEIRYEWPFVGNLGYSEEADTFLGSQQNSTVDIKITVSVKQRQD